MESPKPFTAQKVRELVASRRARFDDRSTIIYVTAEQIATLRATLPGNVFNDREVIVLTCNGETRVLCEDEFDGRSDAQKAALGR